MVYNVYVGGELVMQNVEIEKPTARDLYDCLNDLSASEYEREIADRIQVGEPVDFVEVEQ